MVDSQAPFLFVLLPRLGPNGALVWSRVNDQLILVLIDNGSEGLVMQATV